MTDEQHAAQVFAVAMVVIGVIAGSIVLAIGAAIRDFLARRK